MKMINNSKTINNDFNSDYFTNVIKTYEIKSSNISSTGKSVYDDNNKKVIVRNIKANITFTYDVKRETLRKKNLAANCAAPSIHTKSMIELL